MEGWPELHGQLHLCLGLLMVIPKLILSSMVLGTVLAPSSTSMKVPIRSPAPFLSFRDMSLLTNLVFVSLLVAGFIPILTMYRVTDLQGKWGMRIESALAVRRVKTKGEFNGDIWLGFERLTCVPIQTRMVKESMLSKEEKQWLKVSLPLLPFVFLV